MPKSEWEPRRRGRNSAGRYLRRVALQITLMALFLVVMLILVLPWVATTLSTGGSGTAIQSSIPSPR